MPELTIKAPKLRFQPLTPLEKHQILELSPEARIVAMCRGWLTYGQLCWWASNWPEQVPLINDEFAFLAYFEPGAAEVSITVTEPVAALALAA